MFDKKYFIVSMESDYINPLHIAVRDSVCCYPAYFKIGERGWFLIEDKDGFTRKAHTSPVKRVVCEENRIIVQTVNTKYVFEAIEENRKG